MGCFDNTIPRLLLLGGEDTIITESDTLFSLEGECQTREHIALRKKRRWSEKVGNSVKTQSEVCGGVYSAEVFCGWTWS